MKIGVSSYSFSRYYSAGEMTLAEMVKKSSELGFTGFEMLPRYFGADEATPAQCRELKHMLEDASLDVACYTLASNFGLPEGPDRQAVTDRIRREIENAVVLGATRCRIESSFGPGEGDAATFEEMVDRVVRATKEVADHALKLGVKLGLENHGRCFATFRQCVQVIREVKNPAYGAVPDIGNFLVVDDDPVIACRELAKYAIHVHAKDFLYRPPEPEMTEGRWFRSKDGHQMQGAVVGEGDVPVKECLQALKNRGYDGYLAVEHESPEDPVEGLRRSRAFLEETLASLD
ncbi:MAG TPA: sugar phosphate isomerase/epimerase family protein [Planctomycetota bacterium]|nr:sugar phosphate isomerase/epimerase family protein [Planctomycetota bacterium]